MVRKAKEKGIYVYERVVWSKDADAWFRKRGLVSTMTTTLMEFRVTMNVWCTGAWARANEGRDYSPKEKVSAGCSPRSLDGEPAGHLPPLQQATCAGGFSSLLLLLQDQDDPHSSGSHFDH